MSSAFSLGDHVLGKWELGKKIGSGSFGTVYEARRVDAFGVDATAAVKIITIPQSDGEVDEIRSEGMDEASVTEYFLGFVKDIVQEISIMNTLKGSGNIVSYEDHAVIEHEDGIGWDIIIRMELLTPLQEHILKHPLSHYETVRLGIDICSALEYCRRYGVIHRDIKPENIFVSKTGEFKLGDFGIARFAEKTLGGMSRKGTYTYMAPEIYKGRAYGSSVDTYSLGLVMYRFLNDGRLPFLPPPPQRITFSERDAAMMKRINGTPLPMPSHADNLLGRIVLKACAYDSSERYASPSEMKSALIAAARLMSGALGSYGDAFYPEDEGGSEEDDDFQDERTEADDGGTIYDIPPEPEPPRRPGRLTEILVGLLAVVLLVAAAAAVFLGDGLPAVFGGEPSAGEQPAGETTALAVSTTEHTQEPTPTPTPESTPTPTPEPNYPPNLVDLDLGSAASICASEGYTYTVEYYLRGSGTVISQTPDSSTPAAPGSNIQINVGISESEFSDRLLEQINIRRSAVGAAALVRSSALDYACQILATENVNSVSNMRPNGLHWSSVIDENGIPLTDGTFTTRNYASSLSDIASRLKYSGNEYGGGHLLTPEYTTIGIAFSANNMVVIIVGY